MKTNEFPERLRVGTGCDQHWLLDDSDSQHVARCGDGKVGEVPTASNAFAKELARRWNAHNDLLKAGRRYGRHMSDCYVVTHPSETLESCTCGFKHLLYDEKETV